MGKSKISLIKKAIVIAFSGLLMSPLALADVVSQDGTRLPPLIVIDAPPDILMSLNCDPSVMGDLNNSYLNVRGRNREVELKTLVQEIVNNTPKPEGADRGGSCFEQATKNINTVIDTYNTIVSALSGSFNPGPLINNAKNAAINLACKEVENYTSTLTGNMIGGATAAVNNSGLMTSFNRFTIGAGGASISGQQIANGVISGSTYNTGANNGALGQISSNNIANTLGVNSAINTVNTQGNAAAAGCQSLSNCSVLSDAFR